MRVATFVALLFAIAAAVLLALTTFCLPISKHLWLFKIRGALTAIRGGTLGYSVGNNYSKTKLGYDLPMILSRSPVKGVADKARVIKGLTYALVVFPIGFALAVVAALLAIVGVTCFLLANALALVATILAFMCTAAGIGIVAAIFYYTRRHLPSDIARISSRYDKVHGATAQPPPTEQYGMASTTGPEAAAPAPAIYPAAPAPYPPRNASYASYDPSSRAAGPNDNPSLIAGSSMDTPADSGYYPAGGVGYADVEEASAQELVQPVSAVPEADPRSATGVSAYTVAAPPAVVSTTTYVESPVAQRTESSGPWTVPRSDDYSNASRDPSVYPSVGASDGGPGRSAAAPALRSAGTTSNLVDPAELVPHAIPGALHVGSEGDAAWSSNAVAPAGTSSAAGGSSKEPVPLLPTRRGGSDDAGLPQYESALGGSGSRA
ncbi:hypothetical protein MSPP1_000408 [Malassezia sp. CBS 17886]|nr:hypothetical protein MSPP1_000408 [Malassezia sp. CBS 17886]